MSRTGLHDFHVLLTGQVISALGTRVSGVAFPLLALALTGSASIAGIVGFAETLPLLVLTLPAGALVDRHDRKRLMLACEAGRAIALGAVAAAVWWHVIAVWELALAGAVDGVGFTFFEVAQRASLRQIVPVAELPHAAALNQGREYGALLVGTPLGGALFAVSRAVPFLVDAVSYVVSLACVGAIRAPLGPGVDDRAGGLSRLRGEIAEGVRWLWQQPFLRTTSVLVLASDLTVNALYLVVVVLARRHGASPELVGVLLLFVGAGGVVGTLLAPRALRLLPPRVGIQATLAIITLLLPLIAIVHSPIALGLIYGAMFVAYPTWGATVSAYRAVLVPDRLQGRVQSVATLLALGAVPFGYLAVGFSLQHAGGGPTVAALVVLMACATVYAFASRHVREMPRIDASTRLA